MTDVKHPLAIDLVAFIDGLPPEQRPIMCHLICCQWCRQGAINIIQSSKVGYPDLFADPADHA